MKSCCRAQSCERFFKPSLARRSLETYQKKGLDQLERDLVSHIAPDARTAARVLEIGAASGGSRPSSSKQVRSRGRVVELVAAYEPFASELAREKGLERRTAFRVVDILERPDDVEPADIVVLNRVVCCSPDGVALAAAAGRLTRRTLVLSFLEMCSGSASPSGC